MFLALARHCSVRLATACLALAIGASASRAADKPPAVTLNVGDPAPKLSIGKWVKGEPVKELAKDHVYVMEFWATWCGPCIAAMPHVTKLQAEYKDKGVTVIGVNIWERGGDTSKVAPFVEKNADKMGYTVGMEETIEGSPNRGRMATDWMAAAGRNGIPCSMIVDKAGKIAWIGHPMAMETPLKQIVAGTFDAKAHAAMEEKIAGLNKQAMEAMRAKEYDKALALRDDLAAADPDNADRYKLDRLPIYLAKGDIEAATKLAGEALDKAEAKKDGQSAAVIASRLLMPVVGPKAVDPALTVKAAELALKLSDGSVAYQRLLGQAYAKAGQYDKAADTQAKVVAGLEGQMKEREQKVLDEYKSKMAAK